MLPKVSNPTHEPTSLLSLGCWTRIFPPHKCLMMDSECLKYCTRIPHLLYMVHQSDDMGLNAGHPCVTGVHRIGIVSIVFHVTTLPWVTCAITLPQHTGLLVTQYHLNWPNSTCSQPHYPCQLFHWLVLEGRCRKRKYSIIF